MEILKIQEFIDGKNVSYDTVRKYIKRHANKELKGHLGRENNIDLDDVAVEFLEKKYPNPTPIQIIEDTEVRKELYEAQKYIIELQKRVLEVSEKLAIAENQKLMLDLKEKEIENLKIENEDIADEKEKIKEQLNHEIDEKENYKLELETYEKTWFGFYRKKR